jgi:hypothetical protein
MLSMKLGISVPLVRYQGSHAPPRHGAHPQAHALAK